MAGAQSGAADEVPGARAGAGFAADLGVARASDMEEMTTDRALLTDVIGDRPKVAEQRGLISVLGGPESDERRDSPV